MNKLNFSAFADEASPSLDGQISALLRNGAGFIELRGVDGKNVVNLTPDEARAVRDKLDAAGIAVWSLGSPLGKSDITKPFDTECARLERLIETASILDTKRIRIFSFYIPAGEGAHLWRDEVVTRLSYFAERAKSAGLILCHENEKGIYGDNPERCLDLLNAVPGIKAVFDPANFIQCGVTDMISAWNLLSDKVEYIHVKDATEDGRVVPAGYGVGCLREILRDFSMRVQGGTLSVEPHLKVFSGVEALQREPLPENFEYKSGDDAFDAAMTAAKTVLV